MTAVMRWDDLRTWCSDTWRHPWAKALVCLVVSAIAHFVVP